jgi:hypothetical protein
MISHAGLTYEPIQNIIIDERKFKIDDNEYYDALLILDPGKLGDDPFEAWPERGKIVPKGSEMVNKTVIPGDRIKI